MLTPQEMLLIATRAATYQAAQEYDWLMASCPLPEEDRALLVRVVTLPRADQERYG
jgi:hypothetical protein